jgi:hypothetical protein
MFTPKKLIISLALLLPVIPASAGTLLYVVNGPPSGSAQFGTIDLGTGAFNQIGPSAPEGSQGLVQGPNGSLLTLDFSGNLDSINPVTGVTSLVGPTGLADCAAPPISPCGPHASNSLASAGGGIYVTDLSNNLYRVNPATGAATLVGPTGIPAVPFTPLTVNPDGSFDAFDEGLFGANGKLYATFDAITVDPTTFTTASVVIAPDLYQIDPTTGATTLVGPTDLNLGAVADVNGTLYGFNEGTGQVVSLDLSNGHTTFVTNFDPAAGLVTGAAATPEPASFALAAFGITALALFRRRRRA